MPKEPAKAAPDETADEHTPFERFEMLTKRLLAVRKADVDALREQNGKATT